MHRNEIPIDLTGFHLDPLHRQIETVERWLELNEQRTWDHWLEWLNKLPPPVTDVKRGTTWARPKRIKLRAA